ncbi:MAG: hypothetical protein QOE58_2130 [Actinomycetota bacterium]|nr:hypothetical protein [Actinomycetota bacterium]
MKARLSDFAGRMCRPRNLAERSDCSGLSSTALSLTEDRSWLGIGRLRDSASYWPSGSGDYVAEQPDRTGQPHFQGYDEHGR